MKKIKVGILFGGKSAEHEISLLSANNVMKQIDKNKYEVVPIAIDKEGKWHLKDAGNCLVHENDPRRIALNTTSNAITFSPGGDDPLLATSKAEIQDKIDVIFPVLHGLNGEDGTVQGLLKLAGIPFVGSGVLGSAIGMDKDVAKRLLRDAGIPVAKFLTVSKKALSDFPFERIEKELGLPFFVKPCNGGSSVGVGKVKSKQEFQEKIEEAFRYDNKVLIEEFISGREIECAVLGNDHPKVSLPGEAIFKDEFYSYDEKYMEDGVSFLIPAPVTQEQIKLLQEIAVKAYKALCCDGFARVDFFLTLDGKVLVNEINTIPGLTSTSMYPQLWLSSGVALADVIDQVIQLALEKHSEVIF